MSDLQLAFNATTKAARIQLDGATPPAGSTVVGTFSYPNDDSRPLGQDINHVAYQEVQEVLYQQGVLDMASVVITKDEDVDLEPVVNVTAVFLGPDPADLAVSDTYQLSVVVEPDDATDKSVSFGSSDEAVATVDSEGLVTAVAAGTATITVTTTDGGFTATNEITVVAE